ncbi:hypothetical protein H0A36_01465 [Endozoicomonas sp. SM1973]|uniref:Thiol oxidoreductase n=1 Tax=Spartinivicinus marinus TaxID=2994442 RepID=A0A853I603_9GAMM|nr:hypothetical protein [Spartinivicinus marinus]
MVEATTNDPRYLHDGRAHNLLEAVLWHGSEAVRVVEQFKQLAESERESVINFLKSL